MSAIQFIVDADSGHYHEDGDVAVLSDGGFVVSWVEWPTYGFEGFVYVRIYDSAGQPLGGPVLVRHLTETSDSEGVSTAGAWPWDSDVTVLSNGNILVVWSQQTFNLDAYGQRDLTSETVHAQVLSPTGSLIGSAVVVGSSSNWSRSSEATALSDGGFVLAYTNRSENEYGQSVAESVGVQVYDAAGSPVGAPLILPVSSGYSVTALANGGFVLEAQYQLTVYDSTGAQVGETVSVGAVAGLQVAALAGGGYVATWASTTTISGQFFTDANEPVGDVVALRPFGSRYGTAGTTDGGFVIVWESGDSIYAQRFTSNGSVNGAEFEVAAGVDPWGSWYLSVDDVPGNGFVVAWTDNWDSGAEDTDSIQGVFYLGGESLFTPLADTVNFNALTVEQAATVDAGAGFYHAGAGDDTVYLPDASISEIRPGIFWDSNVVFNGGSGDDQIRGSDRNDRADGGADNDSLYGEAGVDTLFGGAGGDYIDGGSEDDSLIGDAGDDWINGGSGNDDIRGDDLAATQVGDDQIFGDGGNDTIDGGGGADSIVGGDGDDKIEGGAGLDILTGGEGRDTFIFEGAGSASGDRIIDLNYELTQTLMFERAPGFFQDPNLDSIKIVGPDGSSTYEFIGSAHFTASGNGQISYQWIESEGGWITKLMIDVDGDGDPDGSIEINGRYLIRDVPGKPGEYYGIEAPGEVVYLDFLTAAYTPVVDENGRIVSWGPRGNQSDLALDLERQQDVVAALQQIFDSSLIPILVTSIRPAQSTLDRSTTVTFSSPDTVINGEYVYRAGGDADGELLARGAAYGAAIFDNPTWEPDRLNLVRGEEAGIFVDASSFVGEWGILDAQALAELIAHEVGHSYGLRHLAPVVGDTNNEVMDYDFTIYGDLEPVFEHTVVNTYHIGQTGDTTYAEFWTHNAVYHILRYALGYSDQQIADERFPNQTNIVGSWDWEWLLPEVRSVNLGPLDVTKLIMFGGAANQSGGSGLVGQTIVVTPGEPVLIQIPLSGTFEIYAYTSAESVQPAYVFGVNTPNGPQTTFSSASELPITLTLYSLDAVGNITGEVGSFAFNVVQAGTPILSGGTSADNLVGGDGADAIFGLGGADVLVGAGGADWIEGGAGNDTIQGSAAELNGDTIAGFSHGDRILISDATLANFSYSLSGMTLTYTGGSLSFTGHLSGELIVSAAPEGGVQLTLPPPERAKLLLTETGQDFDIGGDVAVVGTTGGGEEIRVIRGDIMLDASFNVGGDTVVLPGEAASYSASLSGSFVTIIGGDISIAIPVGVNGLIVEFADAERILRFDTTSGQVLLGEQVVSATDAPVAAATTPFTSDGSDTGPSSMAKLLLTEAGQDIDIGGNVTIVGTTSGGEVMTIVGGTIMLDASFNVGGDTVMLPGEAASYSASLSGSFVTIIGGDISIAIPVGTAGLAVDFADGPRTLRFDAGTGQVMLGDQVVTSTSSQVGSTAQSSTSMVAAELAAGKEGDDAFQAIQLYEVVALEADSFAHLKLELAAELQQVQFNEGFYFA